MIRSMIFEIPQLIGFCRNIWDAIFAEIVCTGMNFCISGLGMQLAHSFYCSEQHTSQFVSKRRTRKMLIDYLSLALCKSLSFVCFYNSTTVFLSWKMLLLTRIDKNTLFWFVFWNDWFRRGCVWLMIGHFNWKCI